MSARNLPIAEANRRSGQTRLSSNQTEDALLASTPQRSARRSTR